MTHRTDQATGPERDISVAGPVSDVSVQALGPSRTTLQTAPGEALVRHRRTRVRFPPPPLDSGRLVLGGLRPPRRSRLRHVRRGETPRTPRGDPLGLRSRVSGSFAVCAVTSWCCGPCPCGAIRARGPSAASQESPSSCLSGEIPAPRGDPLWRGSRASFRSAGCAVASWCGSCPCGATRARGPMAASQESPSSCPPGEFPAPPEVTPCGGGAVLPVVCAVAL